MEYSEEIQSHYERVWECNGTPQYWYKGPIGKLDPNFCVLEFAPSSKRKMWTYATCCLSNPSDQNPIELHIFSSKEDKGLVELLTSVCYYHQNDNKLDLNHTVNFGKPWQNNSKCDYGFISLPYLDGPALENVEIKNKTIKCYWLIPVTKKEVDFKIKYGAEELENKFDSAGFDYINPVRKSVI